MLERLHIRNYRVFNDLKIDRLSRINIAGKNNSGKTSLLVMNSLLEKEGGRSLFPRQVFFPMADAKDGWAKLARNLKTERLTKT